MGYLDRIVCFVWAVSRGLAGGVVDGEEETEVCLFWAGADDVVKGGGVSRPFSSAKHHAGGERGWR